ncbi:hypothetical protein [Lederbergia citrea]|uniref:Uncharacterized protein n=1 Tax=Lederbergia citrea TaxID=2833581 RepID=A0A942UUF4_9BACI|nr:hypothetical protein [Lederbergia citrea]MBS4223104.1 hypothetical protein [Lederbergia citrea]
MTVNRGSVLGKEYFLSYIKLILKSRNCTLEMAKELTFKMFFHNNKDQFGKETYQRFLTAYEELKNCCYQ